jgi:hypothetical protein
MTIDLALEDTTAPAFQATGFNCPFCIVYAQQTWYRIRDPYGTRLGGRASEDDDTQVWVAQCFRCKKYSVWHKKKMIYPSEGIAPLPHPDLPDDDDHHHDQIKDDSVRCC